jgi:hypothetical protein
MVLNIHNAKVISTSKKNREIGEDVKEPQCIAQYKKHMRGVDRAGQYLSYYSMLWKNTKCLKKAVLCLINYAPPSAFCSYKKLNSPKQNHIQEILA